MIDYLRKLAARVRKSLGPLFPPGTALPPENPYAGVREPRRRGPGDRSSAIAVAEPDPPSRVKAVGSTLHRR